MKKKIFNFFKIINYYSYILDKVTIYNNLLINMIILSKCIINHNGCFRISNLLIGLFFAEPAPTPRNGVMSSLGILLVSSQDTSLLSFESEVINAWGCIFVTSWVLSQRILASETFRISFNSSVVNLMSSSPPISYQNLRLYSKHLFKFNLANKSSFSYIPISKFQLVKLITNNASKNRSKNCIRVSFFKEPSSK